MKKFFAMMALVAFAGVAAGAGFNSLTYYQVDSSRPPNGLSVGLPMESAGVPLKQITVTVSDYTDGGNIGTATTDDDFLRGFTLLAWRKIPMAVGRDAGYTRQPELDITYAANAAALANSTDPIANLQASRAWSATIAGQIVTERCDGANDGGTSGTPTTYNNCIKTTVGNGSGQLPVYAKGSQLYYHAPANGVMTLDAGVKPYLITIDGVY